MKQRRSGAFAALALLCASFYAPALAGVVPPVNPPQLCASKTTCRPVAMPPQVGKISSVIKGDFVPGKTSWIAFGDKQPSLCYETPAPLNVSRKSAPKPLTSCVPVLTDAPYQSFKVQEIVDGSGSKALMFTLADPARTNLPTANLHAIRNFMVALGKAQSSLGRHAAKPKTLANIGGCGFEDGDMFPTCTDTGNGGLDGDYPGGGGGSGWGGVEDPDFAARSTGCIVSPVGWTCSGKIEPKTAGGIPV